MPTLKKVTKSCCPLCEDLAELKYRYDICEECHQDLVNAKPTESDFETQSEDGDTDGEDMDPEDEFWDEHTEKMLESASSEESPKDDAEKPIQPKLETSSNSE